MGDLQVAQGGEDRARRGCGHWAVLMMERLPSSYFFQDGQEDMARMGQGFAKVVTDFTVQPVHLPAVQ